MAKSRKRTKSSSKKASKPKKRISTKGKGSPKKRRAKATSKPKKGSGVRKVSGVRKSRGVAPSAGSGDASGLAEGDAVPSFELPNQDGKLVASSSLVGDPYVLYFYPKDDTPGCTKEACGFRDDFGKFAAKGVRLIGVSPDKPESHARFRDKYGLNFTLLSDVDKQLIQACGVWVKKQNYGREYMGVERSTFLVGADGKVRKVWRRVRVDGHVGDVLGSV